MIDKSCLEIILTEWWKYVHDKRLLRIRSFRKWIDSLFLSAEQSVDKIQLPLPLFRNALCPSIWNSF
jgi:hypothetical protein